eukprot:SAG31_NODE_6569_length_1970_cov_1.594869_2_plen_211_part_00
MADAGNKVKVYAALTIEVDHEVARNLKGAQQVVSEQVRNAWQEQGSKIKFALSPYALLGRLDDTEPLRATVNEMRDMKLELENALFSVKNLTIPHCCDDCEENIVTPTMVEDYEEFMEQDEGVEHEHLCRACLLGRIEAQSEHRSKDYDYWQVDEFHCWADCWKEYLSQKPLPRPTKAVIDEFRLARAKKLKDEDPDFDMSPYQKRQRRR